MKSKETHCGSFDFILHSFLSLHKYISGPKSMVQTHGLITLFHKMKSTHKETKRERNEGRNQKKRNAFLLISSFIPFSFSFAS